MESCDVRSQPRPVQIENDRRKRHADNYRRQVRNAFWEEVPMNNEKPRVKGYVITAVAGVIVGGLVMGRLNNLLPTILEKMHQMHED